MLGSVLCGRGFLVCHPLKSMGVHFRLFTAGCAHMPVTGIAAAPCVGKLVLFGRNCQCGKGSFIFVLIKNFATSFAGIVFLYPGIFAGRLDSAVMLILVFVFNVITQGEGGQPDMLTVYRIGHAQLAVTIVLDEGIETAPLHIGLEHHFALSQIVGVDFENADMLTVCGGIKQEKASIIIDEVGARLAERLQEPVSPIRR